MTRTYNIGEAVVMPDGSPFQLHCSHCDTPHALHHAINDAGEIEMRVFPGKGAHRFTDAVPRRAAMVPTSRTPQRHRFDDPAAYDSDGYLRDGHSISVPMNLMDAAPSRSTGVMVINTGLTGEHALKNFFYPDGTPKPTRAARAQQRKADAAAAATAKAAADAAQAKADFNERYNNPHCPGYRFATTDAAAGTTNDACADAYNLYVRELQDAWKSPERRAQDAKDAARVYPQKPDNYNERFPGEWDRQVAFDQLVAESNRPPPGTRWGDAGIEKQAAQEPRGIWPMVVPKSLGTVKADDRCTVDGADGTYVDGGDGNLYCKVQPMPSARVPPTNPSTDAVPRTMSAADAQVIRDRAYNEMVDQLTNAWRTT